MRLRATDPWMISVGSCLSLGALALLLFIAGVSLVPPVNAQDGSWQPLSLSEAAQLHVDSHAILAATDTGLLRSEDGGTTWDTLRHHFTRRVTVLPGGDYLAGDNFGVYRFDADQSTWTHVYETRGQVTDCAAHLIGVFTLYVRSDSTILAGVSEEGASSSGGCKGADAPLLASEDGGESWDPIFVASNFVYSTLFLNESMGFVGADSDGLYKTFDGGLNWSHRGFEDFVIRDVDSDREGVLYLQAQYVPGGVQGCELHRSVDEGETWEPVGADLDQFVITSMAVHPDGILFAGTKSNGVHFSLDRGVSWNASGSGLPLASVNDIEVGSDGFIYAGTTSGIYRIPLSVATSTEDVTALSAFVLEQNHPNPFTTRTSIRYTLPRSASVRLVVYDILGREVERLRDGMQAAGSHETSFERGALASGVYFYRLEVEGRTLQRRMILAN